MIPGHDPQQPPKGELRALVDELRQAGYEAAWRRLLRLWRSFPRFLEAFAEADADAAAGPSNENVRETISLLERAIAASSSAAPFLLWRGALRRKIVDYRGSAEDLARSLPLAAECPWACTWLGETLIQLGQVERGLGLMNRAVELAPDVPWLHAWRGRSRMNFTGTPEALADLDRAVSLDPLNDWHLAWRAEAKRKLGRLEEALEDFDRSVALRPDSPRTRTWRGLARLSRGLLRPALEDLDAALRSDPSYGLAYHGRSEARLALGDVRGSLADRARAIALNPKFSDLPRGLTEEAARRLADRLAPWADRPRPDFGALLWRAGLLRRLGDPSAAERDVDRARRLRPGDPQAAAAKAELLCLRSEFAGALAVLDQAVRARPGRWLLHAWRARLRFQLCDYAAALRDFDRAEKLDGRSVRVYAERGETKLVLGDRAGALADAEAASRLQSSSPQARVLRALAYGQEGSWSRAREEWASLWRSRPAEAPSLLRSALDRLERRLPWASGHLPWLRLLEARLASGRPQSLPRSPQKTDATS